ncbi:MULTISPECIES: DUF2190 family protein [Nitrosomonas]|uniref:DUF2190 domain-containing protein n=1 Tax=Nitrosomonas communis TaxID=44574 RepID=A0A0F7KEQ9_9PROT|nr:MULTISPECIES: DUF2190 family protein [Nitrosomonas]AKH37294.1 hypothetical protein AAW31_04920 [Nitrosomonas communis]TYP84729.1 hypothetical protein BCL69_103839 [Nitrosomonas communis]UVS62506.1 DUF2190 family protein [Nitrosomonas sp. PLL12]
MANTLLNKNYTAGGAINPYRIVKPGSNDGEVVQAAAATDSLMGVCESVGPASGERCDIVKSGIADLEFAGVVTRGGPVTSDADGKGVAAAPAAGANVRIIGFAEVTTAPGDIAPVLIAPGTMQG